MRDANGQAPSYVYYEGEPGRRSAAKLLSKDEARRIAANYCQAAGASAEAVMSALPPKADIVRHGGNVRFVPIADISSIWTARIPGRCTGHRT